jgi:hypothetical protein
MTATIDLVFNPRFESDPAKTVQRALDGMPKEQFGAVGSPS